MTCIVGLKEDGRIWLGGESANSSDRWTGALSGSKVFTCETVIEVGAKPEVETPL